MNARITLIILSLILFYSQYSNAENRNNIIIENAEMQLTISPQAKVLSLIHKSTGEECLVPDQNVPISAITEYRPYDNELFLTYPAKERTFEADTIYRIGNELKIGFEEIAYTATISLNITDDYIGFKLTKLDYEVESIGVKRRTEIDEFTLLKLPIKKREYFGEWLNVIWDDKVAINLLATDPYAKIDAYKNNNYTLFYAGMENKVKLMDVGAALITTTKEHLLDRIDRVEKDYGLPLGVESRRRDEYAYSYYELRDVTTANIEEHIKYAKQGGFKTMVIYYPDFAWTLGHFLWNKHYPNGMKDLQEITKKIKDAGFLIGFHIHYNKVSIDDPYVTPIPDGRLNQERIFTLSETIDKNSTTIPVEENPENCTLEDSRRLLRIGNEIVRYKSYTTERPFKFEGCDRGVLNTSVTAMNKGVQIGLLDVDTWPRFIRLNQQTSIQDEIAKNIGEIYSQAGFDFVYFDGAEDVHYPYWHTVSIAQLSVYNELKPAPLFSEGALKSHFGWHILTRGNAFDLFKPEDIRVATNRYTVKAAKYIAQDFTSINFGWNDYLAPSEETIGMQPDMYEYICSRSAAWNCPIALMGKLDQIKAHPRTKDNLEVIRAWETARINKVLTQEQKDMLKDTSQEHILLLNEKGEYELYPYYQIKDVANNNPDIRAFAFTRNNKSWVVFWHARGEGKLSLAINKQKVKLYRQLGKRAKFASDAKNIILPANDRLYLEMDLPLDEAMKVFSAGTLR